MKAIKCKAPPAMLLALALAGCAGGAGDGDGSTQGSMGTMVGSGSDAPGEGSEGSTGSADTGSGEGSSEGSTTFGCEQTFYPDVDEDGYGDVAYPVEACLMPPAHIPQGGDCDDTNPDVHPGVEELCDGADNDCNGLVDEASPSNTSCQGCALGLMGDHAYYYCPQALAWADAQLQCMQFSADLLQIADQAEQDFLLAEPLPAAPTFFIGLNDQAVEGTFVWADGSAPGFTAWGMGEPNDANMNEDCGQLSVPAGTWNDIDCAVAAAFICEAVAG